MSITKATDSYKTVGESSNSSQLGFGSTSGKVSNAYSGVGDIENLENGFINVGSTAYNLSSAQISELENQNTILYNTLQDMQEIEEELEDILEKNNLSSWLQEEVGQELKNKITQNYNGLISLRKNLLDFHDGMSRLLTLADQNNKY